MEFDKTQALADFFKALGDETRLKLLTYLLENGEHCVLELCAALGVSQTNASRHLARLKSEGILRDRRDAQCIFYSLDPRFVASKLGSILPILHAYSSYKPCENNNLQFQTRCDK